LKFDSELSIIKSTLPTWKIIGVWAKLLIFKGSIQENMARITVILTPDMALICYIFVPNWI